MSVALGPALCAELGEATYSDSQAGMTIRLKILRNIFRHSQHIPWCFCHFPEQSLQYTTVDICYWEHDGSLHLSGCQATIDGDCGAMVCRVPRRSAGALLRSPTGFAYKMANH